MRTPVPFAYIPIVVCSMVLMGCYRESSSSSSKPIVFQGPDDVLIPGQYHADVMEIGGSQRFIELSKKLGEGLKKHPTLAIQGALKSKPGEPLPYDPRLGLTRAEYEEFLASAPKMIKTADANLTIALSAEGVFRLEGDKLPKDLVGIEIDLNKDQVRTPLGILADKLPIHADDKTAIGAWDGVEWKHEEFSLASLSETIVQFRVGVRKNSRQCVISYNVKSAGLGGKSRITHTLYYNLPETPQHSQ